MAFIRVKKFKRKDGSKVEYAYIVENKRYKRSKKVKQKPKKYLGKVYRIEKVNDVDFFEFHNIKDVKNYTENKNHIELLNDVLKWELHSHGFKKKEGVWSNGDCFMNIKEKRVYNEKGNDVALAFNEGLFCTHNIRNIYNFKATFSDEETGYKLAKAFVEAGIKVPKEVFVGVFEKVVG